MSYAANTFLVNDAMQRGMMLRGFYDFVRPFAGQFVTVTRFLQGVQLANPLVVRIEAPVVTLINGFPNVDYRLFNRMFDVNQNGYWQWIFEGSDQRLIADELQITVGNTNVFHMNAQSYFNVLEEGNCVVSRIKPYYDDIYRDLMNTPMPKKGTKAYRTLTLRRCETLRKIETCEAWLTECAEHGMRPETAQHYVDLLRITLIIQLPVQGVNHQPLLVMHLVSKQESKKRFTFVNVSFCHVELLGKQSPYALGLFDTSKTERLSAEQLDQKRIEFPGKPYRVNGRGVLVEVLTGQTSYVLDDPMTEIKKEFMKHGLINCSLDWKKLPELSEFIESGTHHNGTIDGVDFGNMGELMRLGLTNEAALAEWTAKQAIRNQSQHVDMIKAYASFHKLKHADGKKLLGKLTDFRETNEMIAGFKGMYMAQLDFLAATPIFQEWNEALKFPFRTDTVYTSFELNWLKQQGVKVDVTFGCWGADVEVDFERRTNEEVYQGVGPAILEKGPDGIRNYAKLVGQFQANNANKHYQMDVDPADFGVFRDCARDPLSPQIAIFEEGKVILTYENTESPHLCHITAQILALIRLEMFDLCMTFRARDLVRICSDGLYVKKDVNFVFDENIFQRKTDLKFGNEAGGCYASNVDSYLVPEYLFGNPLPHNMRELLTGPGGSGKTTWAASQCHVPGKRGGFVKPILLAHSIVLREKMLEEFPGVHAKCFQDVFFKDSRKQQRYLKNYNVMIFDEASMITKHMQQMAETYYGHLKLMFMGDIGYQAAPVPPPHVGPGRRPIVEEFDMSTYVLGRNRRHFEHCYRFKDLEMQPLTNKFRRLIELQHAPQVAFQLLMDNIPEERHLTLDGLKQLYTQGDYLITRRLQTIETYTTLLAHIERYKLQINCNGHRKGAIVYKKPLKNTANCWKYYELKHGMTVHATQGTTVKQPLKLFICMQRIMEVRVLYTALSRVQELAQVYLVFHDANKRRRYDNEEIRQRNEPEVDLDVCDAYEEVGPEPEADWKPEVEF